jgi:hypothetical protein
MNRRIMGALAMLAIGGAVLGCSPATSDTATVEAVVVEAIAGSELERLTLSEQAFIRLGVETAPVTPGDTAAGSMAMPYSALIYDLNGRTWAYTNPEGRVFVRHEVAVERIVDELAILTAGPEVGTLVVTVGAAELWGVETGVGGGH